MTFEKLPVPFLVVRLPGMLLVGSANAREHWSDYHRRAKHQRGTTCLVVGHGLRKLRLIPWPILVRIVRVSPMKLDRGDNVNISGKHVRDGVADALGLKDDDDERVEWRYRNEKCVEGQQGARVEFYRRATCECCGQFVAGWFGGECAFPSNSPSSEAGPGVERGGEPLARSSSSGSSET